MLLNRFLGYPAGSLNALLATMINIRASSHGDDVLLHVMQNVVMLYRPDVLPMYQCITSNWCDWCTQEHVGLLRALIATFPGQYGDLGLLMEEDPELDFFNNVAHLQLHRRQRALQRLTKVCPMSSNGARSSLQQRPYRLWCIFTRICRS